MGDQTEVVEILDWLYLLQKKVKIDLGHAERRSGTSSGELASLNKKLDYIDYLIGMLHERL